MNITKGIIPSAQKVLVYGPEGIGKSTFAAQFPDPLFIDTESSTKHMDVARLDAPSSWTMLLEEVQWVKANPTYCKTLVIDTADWAERLAIDHVLARANKTGIEDFGYGKGYVYLAEEFGRLLNLLNDIIALGIHIVFTAHAAMRKFEQPDEAGAYDRWELKLQKKTAPLLKEWADMVLFANYKTIIVKDENKKARAQGGKRTLYTTHHIAWDAKNRHGLPEEVPFEFTSIAEALAMPATLSAPAAAAVPTTPAVAVSSSVTAAPVPVTGNAVAKAVAKATEEVPAHLKPLYDLMTGAAVNTAEVRQVVAQKGYFSETTPLEKYPEDFVAGVLVGAWPQVFEAVKANRTYADESPFL